MFLVLLNSYPEVELLGHMVALCLNFGVTVKLFPTEPFTL